MNDRIAQMAREAGLPSQVTAHPAFKQFVKAHAAMVAEDCAKVCESDPERQRGDGVYACDQQACAQAIRERYK